MFLRVRAAAQAADDMLNSGICTNFFAGACFSAASLNPQDLLMYAQTFLPGLMEKTVLITSALAIVCRVL